VVNIHNLSCYTALCAKGQGKYFPCPLAQSAV
jgi:hypothetical protein